MRTFAIRKMKLLSYILGLGILILSCITCEDLPEFNDPGLEIISATNIKKPCTESAQDHCSPLCVCACCGQPLINLFFKDAPLLDKRIAVSKKNFEYKNTFVSDYFQSIWQPPKLNSNIFG